MGSTSYRSPRPTLIINKINALDIALIGLAVNG